MIVAARLVEDRRRAVLWWTGGLVLLVLFTVSLYPSIKDAAEFDELVENLPEAIRSVIGQDAGVSLTSPAGYLHGRLFSTLLPLLLLVFAIGGGARAIGGSEEEGTLEPLLANPVSRSRVYAERYVATIGQLVVLGVVFVISLALLGPPFDALDGIAVAALLGASAGALALAILHGTLAYALGASTGRRGIALGIAASVAVAGYLVQTLVTLTGAPSWLLWLTPWHWYLDRNMLAEGAAPLAVIIPSVLSVVLLVGGWRLFLRRDLR